MPSQPDPTQPQPEIPGAETLHRWDRDHVWHPFEPHDPADPHQPPLIARGEGCWLVDDQGHRLLDAVSSLWCNLHGHRVPHIDQAIRDQLDQLAHATLLGAIHAPAAKLARKLAEIAPPGLTRVYYSDDGATAIEAALKIAFQYQQQRPDPKPRKNRFLALNEAYHGDTLGAVAVGDIPRFHRQFGPLLFPVQRACQPFCYRCPLGLTRPACNLACATEATRLIEQHANELAAVIVEPIVQGAAGMVVAPPGWLRTVADACRRHDVLLIADEVATGFGRTGKLFACEHEGVTPDLLCLAKGLTGGYLPLAATLATEKIFSAFCGPPSAGRAFYHGHTYAGNPLGAAAALASLDLLLAPGYLEQVETTGQLLENQLAPLTHHPHVAEIRRKGLMLGIELVQDRANRTPFPTIWRMGRVICDHARSKGVLLRPLGDVLVLMPPLSITPDEIGFLSRAVIDSIQDKLGETA